MFIRTIFRIQIRILVRSTWEGINRWFAANRSGENSATDFQSLNRSDRASPSDRVLDARRVSHLQNGTPDHDSDPEFVVSADGPESPAVPGDSESETVGFQESDPAALSRDRGIGGQIDGYRVGVCQNHRRQAGLGDRLAVRTCVPPQAFSHSEMACSMC